VDSTQRATESWDPDGIWQSKTGNVTVPNSLTTSENDNLKEREKNKPSNNGLAEVLLSTYQIDCHEESYEP
jgi:hypothetical protein